MDAFSINTSIINIKIHIFNALTSTNVAYRCFDGVRITNSKGIVYRKKK